MSSMEINMGKLVPTEWTDYQVKLHIWNAVKYVEDYYDSIEEMGEDYKDYLEEIYMKKLNGVWYRVTDRVTYGEDGDICNLTKQPDGTIDFFTQHYNGGGDWSDELEYNLEKVK